MECSVEGCTRPDRYKKLGLCYGHYNEVYSRENLDKMLVRPCLGGCGKRVHNMRKIIVPNVIQGHGPKMAYCSGCADKRVPDPEEARVRKNKGPCRRCERPMQGGLPEAGFVKHKARGLCTTCYGRFYGPIDLMKVEKRRRLNANKVAQIKRRLANGEKQYNIGYDFGVSKDVMYRIANGLSWRNVDAAADPH